ncbi:hypothetical protein [Georgenia sp. AZ-5]|uniref:hypothetical protein n=1 Tax=Georgenia sp. AZ-5 TaxID=3367526 RepID=UPI0037546D9D
MARTTRRTVIAAAVLVAGLTGCSVANPITTQIPYAPSDGIRVSVTNGVSVENLMILTEGEGEPAHLLGAVANNSTEPISITFALGDSGQPIPVRAGSGDTVNFTGAGISTATGEGAPGSTLPATVSADGVGDIEVEVPVLDGTLPPYDEYLEDAA